MRKYLMFTLVWLLTSICVANRVDVNEVLLTDAHSWDLEYIELHDDYTLCKWKVTSLVENSYVYMTKGVYLEDVISGRKYYAKGIDGLPYEPEMKIINSQYGEVDFIVKFEPLPKNVSTVHYISSPSFQIRNVELVKREYNINDMIDLLNQATRYEDSGNHAAAVNIYKKMADNGFSIGQYSLANSYLRGIGVERDLKKAAYWAKKSAQAGGFSEGMLLYANFCFEGIGVERNIIESAKWMLKAAEAGNSLAQCFMGMNYDAGTGVQQNYAEAVKWYRKAAESGIPDAANNLAALYEAGKGVKTDVAEAGKWYLFAAEKGFPDSQYAIGMFYLYKEGWKQDKAEGIRWLKLAAKNGYTKAQIQLAKMEE